MSNYDVKTGCSVPLISCLITMSRKDWVLARCLLLPHPGCTVLLQSALHCVCLRLQVVWGDAFGFNKFEKDKAHAQRSKKDRE